MMENRFDGVSARNDNQGYKNFCFILTCMHNNFDFFAITEYTCDKNTETIKTKNRKKNDTT